VTVPAKRTRKRPYRSAATPDEDEGRPAVAFDAPLEGQRTIGRERGIGLRRQQPGQNDAGAGRCEPPQRRGDPLQRPEQDVGEDEIERRRLANAARADAIRLHHGDDCVDAVESGIGARDAHRACIHIGREHALPQRARGGDGEHAVAGAEIEDFHAASIIRFANPVERHEAAARGAVVAGAEGERRLDFDADAVWWNAAAVVRPVNDETAGRDRRQAGKAFAHPIRGADAREAQRHSRFFPAGGRHRSPHRGFVRRRAKIERDAPAPAAAIGQARRDIFGGETLGNAVGDFVRRLFTGFERRCHGRMHAWTRAGSH